jgi:hypothetical protein
MADATTITMATMAIINIKKRPIPLRSLRKTNKLSPVKSLMTKFYLTYLGSMDPSAQENFEKE